MADNNPFAKKRTDEEINALVNGEISEPAADNDKKKEKIPHKFNMAVAVLIWLGVSLIAAIYEIFSMYYSDPTLFGEGKGYLIGFTVAISVLISLVSVFVNWIVSSLIFFFFFKKVGKNEVTYRSVLYYYLKNAWVYALWSAVSLAFALILKSPNFLTSVPGIIITAIFLAGFYVLLYLGIRKDFKINRSWVYFVAAAVFWAITVGYLIYLSTDAFSSAISSIGG